VYSTLPYRWFDRFILATILANSITLALYDYSDRTSLSQNNQSLDLAGSVFTIIFFLEAILKIVAMGFVFHKRAYLRDPWNFIDLVIVITG
jgi:voltage-dependent calcium channel L type alpha-1D